MAIPTSKSTFKDYCFRALGSGVIDINVSDDQADDRMMRHYNSLHSIIMTVSKRCILNILLPKKRLREQEQTQHQPEQIHQIIPSLHHF